MLNLPAAATAIAQRTVALSRAPRMGARGWTPVKAGPTVIPTLAARSRQRQLQDLALGRTPTPRQVESEPPLALLSYLQTSDSSELAISAVAEAADRASELETQPSCVVEAVPQHLQLDAVRPAHPMPSWMELLIWLALLLVDGALALRDLISQRHKPVIHPHHGNSGKVQLTGAHPWLRGDLPPASLA